MGSSIDTSSSSFLSTEKFDIIIVGGGTTGLVVASRLTEDPNVKALVLEAGPNNLNDPGVIVPGAGPPKMWNPDFDWCIMSPPQPSLNGRQIAEPKARMLGGSTAYNLNMVMYPSKATFDAWQQLGNPTWGWEGFKQYLRKFETFSPPSEDVKKQLSLDYVDMKEHGTNGPIQISFGDSYPDFNEAWPKVFHNLKHDLTADPSSGVSTGAFNTPGTIDPKTKTRSHAGSAYYTPEVAKRPNLHVLAESPVEKILLEKASDGSVLAKGVRIKTKDGQEHNVFAEDEVVLAAGGLQSPQLLELSGIGSNSLLSSYGIETIIDNSNVGENLQNHGYVPTRWEIADGQMSGDLGRDPAVAAAITKAYQAKKSGPLATSAIGSAYMPMVDVKDEEFKNLIQKYIDGSKYKDFPGQKKQ
ncbi:MAG: hypothetical protein M1834_007810 [Cirrosporium novae-zelandiae]|nr:MAG: hypothetical protein M1834_007810 [Cirrosporium novae-zelandiae]